MYLLYILRVGPVTGMLPTTQQRLPPSTCCPCEFMEPDQGLFDVALKPKAGHRFHPPACAKKKNVSVRLLWTNNSCFTIFIHK